MNKKEIEQLILVIWTFAATLLDLRNADGDVDPITLSLIILIVSIIYYFVGLVILMIINAIRNLIKI